MKAMGRHKKTELHFHHDFEDDLVKKEKQFTYRNGNRLQDFDCGDVVDIVIDAQFDKDFPQRVIGKLRIVAMATMSRKSVDEDVLNYLELYYNDIADVVTLIEFEVL